MAKLKKRDIDAATTEPGKTLRLWDDDPRGFGLYIKPSGVRSFFVQYLSPVTSKKRRVTIGQYGRFTLDEARTEARRILARVSYGEDPLKTRIDEKQRVLSTAISISELCDNYMRDAEAGLVTYRRKPKKPSTIATDHGRIERHIKPLLGDKLVCDVTKRDIEQTMNGIRLGKTAMSEKTGPRGRAVVTGGAGTATRTIGLLGSIFSYAVKQGVRDDNPVRGVERPVDGTRDRILTPIEYEKLGKAFDHLTKTGSNKVALRAYYLLALTGCRRSEVFSLKKTEIDLHNKCLRLEDTKTGRQVRVLGRHALDVLAEAPFEDDSEYAFPAQKGNGHLTDAKLFKQACDIAGLKDISLHTLRHGFASVGLELEYSELTIAGLLGHRSHSITSKYAHHVDRALIAAADRISSVIALRMFGGVQQTGEVIPWLRKEK